MLESFLAKQRRKVTTRLLSTVKERKHILDIGCSAHPRFLREIDFSEKYGIDKIIAQESQHSSHGGSITLLNVDIENEPKLLFEDNYFDAVTMLAVFEHIEPSKLEKVLSEIARVLKPGGVFVFTTPASWTDKLLRILALLRVVSPVEIKEHKDAYNHRQIINYLTRAHFPLANIDVGYFELFMNIWARARKGAAK